jgi:hypothetical protein
MDPAVIRGKSSSKVSGAQIRNEVHGAGGIPGTLPTADMGVVERDVQSGIIDSIAIGRIADGIGLPPPGDRIGGDAALLQVMV